MPTPLSDMYRLYLSGARPDANTENLGIKAKVRRIFVIPGEDIVEGKADPALYRLFASALPRSSNRRYEDLMTDACFGVAALFADGLRHNSKVSVGQLCSRAWNRKADGSDGREARCHDLISSQDIYQFGASFKRVVGFVPDTLREVDLDDLYWDLHHKYWKDSSDVQIKWLRNMYNTEGN